DAIVVGAGIAGAATACYLAKSRRSVALIDMHHPGWGASGRNPGFLWLQTKAAGLSMDFSLACRAFAATLPDQFGEFGFRQCGGLVIYRDAGYAKVADAFVADRRAAGLPVEHVGREAVRELCPDIGPEVSGAVYNPLDAHQDTRVLLRLIVDAFETAGGEVLAPIRVVGLEVSGSSCSGVRLADGTTLSAPTVVIAAGPWTNDLLDPVGLSIPYQPVRFEAAETAPAPFRVGPVVAGQALFRFFVPPGIDAETLPRDPSQLIRRDLGFTEQIASVPDGSLQFGCAYEVGSTLDQATVAGQAMACSVHSRNFPALAGLPVTRQWAGIVAQTPDGLPVIDADTGMDGLVLNAGHFFGNLAGAYSGRLVAQLVSKETPAYPMDGFSRRRFYS
ncbi:MAG: FAD-binding oxidoreductase, partial [Hyphomicrobiales bacterium]|nr:FAD-binding oxidoreductase [Hyphomicrobiales bacterium]